MTHFPLALSGELALLEPKGGSPSLKRKYTAETEDAFLGSPIKGKKSSWERMGEEKEFSLLDETLPNPLHSPLRGSPVKRKKLNGERRCFSSLMSFKRGLNDQGSSLLDETLPDPLNSTVLDLLNSTVKDQDIQSFFKRGDGLDLLDTTMNDFEWGGENTFDDELNITKDDEESWEDFINAPFDELDKTI
jgi:hypothetical protein